MNLGNDFPGVGRQPLGLGIFLLHLGDQQNKNQLEQKRDADQDQTFLGDLQIHNRLRQEEKTVAISERILPPPNEFMVVYAMKHQLARVFPKSGC